MASPDASAPPTRAAFLLVFVATVGFAFKGVIAGVAYRTGLTVFGLVMLRVAFATPLYWSGALLMRGRSRAEGATRRDVVVAMLAGCFFLAAASCDFAAVDRIGAGPSRVILFSFPGFVLLFEGLKNGRVPSARELLTFAIAWAGLLLVAMPEGPSSFRGDVAAGAGFALTGAVSYAAFLVAGQGATRRLGSVRFTALANTGTACAMLLALPLASPEDFVFTKEAVAWIALMAFACTVIPFFLLFEGIDRAGAARASLITLAGPPITVTAAWLLLGERLTSSQVLGTALVIVAIAILQGVIPLPGRLRPGGTPA